MFCDLKKEDVLMQVREKLRDDKIKLWLEPYYNETKGTVQEELKRLAQQFSASLKIDFNSCLEVLIDLQESSVENLKLNTRFKESGQATLKIKILHPQSPPKIIRKELLLSMKASELKALLIQDLTVSDNGLKLISSGKVLIDNDPLLNQGVKHGSMILAIIVGDGQTEMKENEEQIKELEAIKSDSRLLALDDQYLELEDQFGNTVRMPPAEKESLVIAMTLQKKGESAMKKGDYSRALVMFLEADQEYKSRFENGSVASAFRQNNDVPKRQIHCQIGIVKHR